MMDTLSTDLMRVITQYLPVKDFVGIMKVSSQICSSFANLEKYTIHDILQLHWTLTFKNSQAPVCMRNLGDYCFLLQEYYKLPYILSVPHTPPLFKEIKLKKHKFLTCIGKANSFDGIQDAILNGSVEYDNGYIIHFTFSIQNNGTFTQITNTCNNQFKYFAKCNVPLNHEDDPVFVYTGTVENIVSVFNKVVILEVPDGVYCFCCGHRSCQRGSTTDSDSDMSISSDSDNDAFY